MWPFRALLVAASLVVPLASRFRGPAVLLSSGANATTSATIATPVRCGVSVCKPFGTSCSTNDECVTDHCSDGKCSNGPTCRNAGEVCRTYATHTCCTGTCSPVLMKHDCLKLLNGTRNGDSKLGSGVNVDRQCDTIGVCDAWPGSDSGPGKLSTPWAVPSTDIASKYWNMNGITFAEGVGVHADLFVARKVGQKYDGVQPDTMNPASIRDAGMIEFAADSTIATDLSMGFTEGATTFCVAPVTRGGWGGGFYAIGRDCCETSGGTFTCGDINSKKALVVVGQVEKYASIALRIEGTHGMKYQSPTHGIISPRPMFVHFVDDPAAAQAAPPSLYLYVTPQTVTTCVAPIWDAATRPTGKVEFWAVGTECCSLKGGFQCGATGTPGARSGAVVLDGDGAFGRAIQMASVRWGVSAPARPLMLSWTAETLVGPPR